jgi:hypothetical protein
LRSTVSQKGRARTLRLSRIGLAPNVKPKESRGPNPNAADEQPAFGLPVAEDRPLNRGSEREMSATEALMWCAESDPPLRSTICALEEADVAPDWDRFLVAHEWATRFVPRFRQRVVEPTLGIGVPAWVVDPDSDRR